VCTPTRRSLSLLYCGRRLRDLWDLSVYLIKMIDPCTRCPEPEVLAAYVDRGLSLAERARVDQHLASCPQCIALLAGVVRTVADVLESTLHAEPAVRLASRAATRRTLVGVLAAAAAVLVILATPSLVGPLVDGDTGLVNLVGVGEQRSVLGRLTGGFPHAPLVVPTAGGQVGRAAETDRILLAAAKIRESFGERETPSRLHDLGLSQLLAGRHDEAAEALLAMPGNECSARSASSWLPGTRSMSLTVRSRGSARPAPIA